VPRVGLFHDKAIFLILYSVLSLRSSNHEFYPP
jgi:hypothetical protein